MGLRRRPENKCSARLELRTDPGDNRARTGNLRRAKAVLSQLSYAPIEGQLAPGPVRTHRRQNARTSAIAASVGLARVELATSRLSGVRSNQLSYRPLYMKQRANP